MLKKSILIILLAVPSIFSYAQETKGDNEKIKTKMDVFSSTAGSITKLTDTKLPNLKTSFGPAETRIRMITNGSSTGYFYQISKEGKYNNSVASIEYSDLVELLKALEVLKNEVDSDIASDPDYMENKFVTVDGFQLGYYINGAKASWYLKLEKYGSDNTIFINSGETIEAAFLDAKNKIDELNN